MPIGNSTGFDAARFRRVFNGSDQLRDDDADKRYVFSFGLVVFILALALKSFLIRSFFGSALASISVEQGPFRYWIGLRADSAVLCLLADARFLGSFIAI